MYVKLLVPGFASPCGRSVVEVWVWFGYFSGVSAVVSGLVDDATTAVTDAVANITLDSVADTTVDSEPAGDITQEIITDMT